MGSFNPGCLDRGPLKTSGPCPDRLSMLVTMIVRLSLALHGSATLTVCVPRFQITDEMRQQHTQQQRARQSQAVVRVKLHLG